MEQKKKKRNYGALLHEMRVEWRWLLRYVKRYWWGVCLYIAIGLVGTGMGLGASVASKYLIDAVITHSKETIVNSAALVIGLAVFQIVMTALTSRISSLVGSKVNKEIQSDFFERLILSEWTSISPYHSGDLITRLEGDIATVSSSVVSFLPSLVTRTAQFLGALCIVLYYDKTMALLALLGSPIIVLTSHYMVKRIRAFSKESRELNSRILAYGEESLQNLQTVKAFDLTRTYTANFKTLLTHYREVKLNYDKFSILMTMFLSFVGLIVSYACYGWGVWRLWQGAITFGTMTLFLQLSGTLTSSFSTLVSLAPSAISIATSAGRIMELMEIPPEEDPDPETATVIAQQAKNSGVRIRADHVSFTYHDGQSPVLNCASFYAEPGETVAIIGSSGEGKTTMLRLLLGLLRPDSGQLSIEIPNGSSIPISVSTRKLFAYVPQGGSLFSGTVAENLRMVRSDASDQELEQALRVADAWDFISALPNGLQTVIGEKGVNFSEGQCQRFAIARAVLRSAPVLLLDEATSALDVATENRVLQSLMQNDPLRTCILTTHRPSMLRYCQRIYRIDSDGGLEAVDPGECSSLSAKGSE